MKAMIVPSKLRGGIPADRYGEYQSPAITHLTAACIISIVPLEYSGLALRASGRKG